MTATKEVTSRFTSPARQDRSRQTLGRILEATERLMAGRPFRSISVAEIAREAGASISSFYARFPDKEALLGAIFEQHAQRQRAMADQLLAPARWQNMPLAEVLRAAFPLIVAGYQARQGLIRAFLEQSTEDPRFRQSWGEVGEVIIERVTQITLARSFEVDHPDPPLGVRLGLRMVFATLAHRIQMREMESPEMPVVTEELIRVMLRYMGIQDVPAPTY